jgi:hypothetical protein
MSFMAFIYLILLALLIVIFFSFVFHVKGPWGSFWTYFLIIFFSIWIADIWLRPLGPYWGDVYWLPPLIAGLLVAFILAAATPTRSRARRTLTIEDRKSRRDDSATMAVGIFFWITLVVLLLLIVIGYFR